MSLRHARSGKERRQVRAALHAERPAFQVGKGGVDAAIVGAIDQALTAREALKIRVGPACPLEPAATAEALAVELRAEVISVTGRTLILYRPNPDETGH